MCLPALDELVYYPSPQRTILLLLSSQNKTDSLEKPGANKHPSSASSSGPVEMGFKYAVTSSFHILLEALQRMEAKIVFPTSVLAPNIL